MIMMMMTRRLLLHLADCQVMLAARFHVATATRAALEILVCSSLSLGASKPVEGIEVAKLRTRERF